jgi:hypothetical protein
MGEEVKQWKSLKHGVIYPGSTYSTTTLVTSSTTSIASSSKNQSVVDVVDIVAFFHDAEEADEELMKAKETREKDVLKCERADLLLSQEKEKKESKKRLELRNA